MPRVVFTKHLVQFAPSADGAYAGGTVREALAAAFDIHPRLKSYILDDQGRVRRHVSVFVDGAMVARAHVLDAPLRGDSEVYVMQALSGG